MYLELEVHSFNEVLKIKINSGIIVAYLVHVFYFDLHV